MSPWCEDCTEYGAADGFVSIAGRMSVRAETRALNLKTGPRR
jgi:hypothetical protein